jgi:hypothetical protein
MKMMKILTLWMKIIMDKKSKKELDEYNICSVCGNIIEHNEKYVQLSINIEKEYNKKIIVVGIAQSLASYHIKCYPNILKQVKNG